MDEEGHLLIILHAAPTASDDADRTAAFFWKNPKGEWKSSPETSGMTALEEHLKGYQLLVDSLDREVEQTADAKEYFRILKNATPLLRATRHLLEALQAAREARKEDRKLLLMRDKAIELERAIDLAHSDARDGMEFLMAENAAEQAEFSHQATLESRRLNRLVAFFFPLATLISLFGMDDPKELIKSQSFWWIISIGILLGLIVSFIVSKGRRSRQ